jgi:hypothetical protein
MFQQGDAILRESFRSKEYNNNNNNKNNNNNNVQGMNNIKASYLILSRTDDYRQK